MENNEEIIQEEVHVIGNGFIYPFIKFLIDKTKYLNLVELFKYIAKCIVSKNNSIAASRIAVDIFIVLKWLFVILIWYFAYSNLFFTVLVWYLIITNLYTYFYYHIWSDEALKTDDFTKDRIRRRFVNLILAFAYSILCFAYLFQFVYFLDINWSNKNISFINAIMFSFNNSLGGSYSNINPQTDLGNFICSIQLLVTFIFATLILSRSIPQTNSLK